MDTPVNSSWNTDNINNVAASLTRQAHSQPNATAIHYPEGTLFKGVKYTSCSYQELNELSNWDFWTLLPEANTASKREPGPP